MKVLFYSDTHFLHEPSTDRSHKHLRTCEWIANQINDFKPDMVINAGDTNHTHDYVSVHTLHLMMRGLQEIYEACRYTGARHVINIGNHDQATKDGKVHAGTCFGGVADVVVDTAATVDDGVVVVAHSYNLDETRKRIEQRCRGETRLLVVHQDIIDARWNYARMCDRGLSPDELLEYSTSVVGGHHHHMMTDGGFAIVGSPMYLSFNDSIQFKDNGAVWGRGVMLWKGGKRRWVTNPETYIYHTAIGMAEVNRLRKFTSSMTTRIRMRVRCQTEEDYEAALEDAFGEFGSVKVVKDFTKDNDTPVPTVTQTHTPSEVVDTFIEAADTGKMKKDKLRRVGRESIHAVQGH